MPFRDLPQGGRRIVDERAHPRTGLLDAPAVALAYRRLDRELEHGRVRSIHEPERATEVDGNLLETRRGVGRGRETSDRVRRLRHRDGPHKVSKVPQGSLKFVKRRRRLPPPRPRVRRLVRLRVHAIRDAPQVVGDATPPLRGAPRRSLRVPRLDDDEERDVSQCVGVAAPITAVRTEDEVDRHRGAAASPAGRSAQTESDLVHAEAADLEPLLPTLEPRVHLDPDDRAGIGLRGRRRPEADERRGRPLEKPLVAQGDDPVEVEVQEPIRFVDHPPAPEIELHPPHAQSIGPLVREEHREPTSDRVALRTELREAREVHARRRDQREQDVGPRRERGVRTDRQHGSDVDGAVPRQAQGGGEERHQIDLPVDRPPGADLSEVVRRYGKVRHAPCDAGPGVRGLCVIRERRIHTKPEALRDGSRSDGTPQRRRRERILRPHCARADRLQAEVGRKIGGRREQPCTQASERKGPRPVIGGSGQSVELEDRPVRGDRPEPPTPRVPVGGLEILLECGQEKARSIVRGTDDPDQIVGPVRGEADRRAHLEPGDAPRRRRGRGQPAQGVVLPFRRQARLLSPVVCPHEPDSIPTGPPSRL